MGCDIHLFIEIKNEADQWVHHDWRAKHKDGEDEDGSPIYNYESLFKDPFDVGRNYNLFAVLADVRNGRGFAGVDSGDALNTISDPRGMPIDVTSEVSEEADSWGDDGHSHSYHTLATLELFDWNQVSIQRGIVDADGFRTLTENGSPNAWCGGVGGGRVKMINNAEMQTEVDRIKDGGNVATISHLYTRVQWEEKYADCFPYFVNTFIPALRQLCGDPDRCRIVFWFDN